MNAHNKKYNTIMPQTTDRVICIEVDKPISKEGYEENFLPRVVEMIKKHGEIRILVHYKEFHGWEESAAKLDLQASAEYHSKLKKIALVNTPEKEIFHRKFKQKILGGDVQFFNKDELEKAIEWVSN